MAAALATRRLHLDMNRVKREVVLFRQRPLPSGDRRPCTDLMDQKLQKEQLAQQPDLLLGGHHFATRKHISMPCNASCDRGSERQLR